MIQHFATQPVGNFRRAFDEATDLQIDPREQLLDRVRRENGVVGDRREEPADGPPERCSRRAGHRILDRMDGLLHHRDTGSIASKNREQSLLIRATLVPQKMRCLRHGASPPACCKMPRRARQIGKKKIGRRCALIAAQVTEGDVIGIELERHRRRPLHQIVEISCQSAAGRRDRRDLRIDHRLQCGFEQQQMPFDLFDQRDRAVEPDNLQRAGGLMDVRLRLLQRGLVVRSLAEFRKRFESPRDRLVDLVLDPRQRTEIERIF